MVLVKIKSHAKLNLALNVTGKTNLLHNVESIVSFAKLHDEIFIKKIKSKNHIILFIGKFAQNIGKDNTVSKLLEILDKKKILKDKKFKITINKKIPNKAGLGGGSMNAASILNYFIKKKIIKISKTDLFKVSNLIGSDVILGLKNISSVLKSDNKIKYFTNCKKFYVLIVKPNFGCSTREIFSKVKEFQKAKFSRPSKKMFNLDYLKNTGNSLESIAFDKYGKLKTIKSFLENSSSPAFVRMTGSGSALVAYFISKERCMNAKIKFNRKYKNYWCIISKTI